MLNPFNLDESMNTVVLLEALFDTNMKITALTKTPEQKGICTENDIRACEMYLRNLQETKLAQDGVEQIKRDIQRRKRNPEEHLKDLFAARLKGEI